MGDQQEGATITELVVFGAIGALEGFGLIPIYAWVHSIVGRVLHPARGTGRRTVATAVTSVVALSLDLLPLTYAATLVFPAEASPKATVRGEVWLYSWLAALAVSGAILLARRRKAT